MRLAARSPPREPHLSHLKKQERMLHDTEHTSCIMACCELLSPSSLRCHWMGFGPDTYNCLRFFAPMGRPTARDPLTTLNRSVEATAAPGAFPLSRQAEVRFPGHAACSSPAGRCTLQRLVQTTIGVSMPSASEATSLRSGCFSGEEP